MRNVIIKLFIILSIFLNKLHTNYEIKYFLSIVLNTIPSTFTNWWSANKSTFSTVTNATYWEHIHSRHLSNIVPKTQKAKSAKISIPHTFLKVYFRNEITIVQKISKRLQQFSHHWFSSDGEIGWNYIFEHKDRRS